MKSTDRLWSAVLLVAVAFLLNACLGDVMKGVDKLFEKPKVQTPSGAQTTKTQTTKTQTPKPKPASTPKPAPSGFEAPAPFTGIVAAHNAWRAKVGAPPLSWSNDLARFAQEWANQLAAKGCKLEHRSNNPYGENLAWASGTHLSPEAVVNMWAAERLKYDYKTNTCDPGQVCGHYTQVVWKDSTKLGCGLASCGDQEIWVCNYDPPGNYVGQKPY